MIAERWAQRVALLMLACCTACVAPTNGPTRDAQPVAQRQAAIVQPVNVPAPAPSPAVSPAFVPTPVLARPTTFVFAGALEQGGWMRGRVPAGTVSARLGDEPLSLDGEGRFFAAFDRDAGPMAELVAMLRDGRTIVSPVAVAPRAWQIEHVNLARSPSGPSEAFMARRRPELARIAAARAQQTDSDGWRQTFVWPVTGRISGRFGAQRIYRGGEPGAYHSGIDIAAGGSGTEWVAPADGVVVLAAQAPFSLEGNLVIIDHGEGLNSAFLHSSAILVHQGDHVKQGQVIGRIGMTGRATGPHLHWSLMWRGSRLDPLLFTGPMQ